MERQKTGLKTTETADRSWVLVDVEDHIVGRVATHIASLLRGKDRPSYTPHVDNGSFVVVINADKVRFSGKKMQEKTYYHHTGYIGGMKSITAEKQLVKHPDRILREAIWGMLPKNRLSRHLMRKLKIYAGTEHPHTAQLPTTITLS